MIKFSNIAGRLGLITGIGCTVHCFFEYVCDFVVCSGESMQPTLNPDNVLITNKIALQSKSIKRNDIVIAIHPNNPKGLICKRLVGVPGDIVLITPSPDDEESKDESDSSSDEESIASQRSTTKRIYITPGSCWLEGDNKLNSTDSRNYGQVPLGLVKSKVLARVWPLSEFRVF